MFLLAIGSKSRHAWDSGQKIVSILFFQPPAAQELSSFYVLDAPLSDDSHTDHFGFLTSLTSSVFLCEVHGGGLRFFLWGFLGRSARVTHRRLFLKNAFTQTVTPPEAMDSSLETVAVSSSNEGSPRGVRRHSAAMLGLALSMGTTGMLLPGHHSRVQALESPAPQQLDRQLPQTSSQSVQSVPTLVASQPISGAVTLPAPPPLTEPTPRKETPATEFVASPVPVATISQPVAIAVSPKPTVHQVQPGETLSAIAAQYQIAPEKLVAANHLQDPDRLKPTQALTIPVATIAPDPAASLPKPTDSPQQAPVAQFQQEVAAMQATPAPAVVVAKSPEVVMDEIPDPVAIPVQAQWQNDRPVSTKRQTAIASPAPSSPQYVAVAPVPVDVYNPQVNFAPGENVTPQLPGDPYAPMQFNGYIWPAKGVLSSGFGPRWGRMHRGIDIAAPIGTPIYAAADGEVISAGWNNGGYGNLVKIRHGDGSVTFYAHSSKIFVQTGERVTQGQQIAAIGSTGFSTGPHLHFEVRPGGGSAVNPIAFLPRR